MCRVHLLWLRIPHLVMGIRCEGGSPLYHVAYRGGDVMKGYQGVIMRVPKREFLTKK